MDRFLLKQSAAQSLAAAGNSPRKLLLIYRGAAAVLSLLVCAVCRFLLQAMNSSGGLSALGTQAVYATVAVVFRLLPVILMPFWSAGLYRGLLLLSRGEDAPKETLLEGFRRFGPVLSAGIFRLVQYAVAGFVAVYLGWQLFLCTPLAQPLYTALLSGAEELSIAQLSTGAQLVCGGMILAVFALLSAPVFYRYRMVEFAIMDGATGLQALLLSSAMMRRRRLKLLRLDLSFWWIWVLLLLGGLAANAPTLLGLPGELTYWGCAMGGLVAQVAVYALAMPKAMLTYAHCYEEFRKEPEPEPVRHVGSQSHPWDGWQ